jgi:hypothetical protein
MSQEVENKMTNMNIEGIRLHEQLQPRVEMDQALIHEYAEAITNGAKFPAVTVFQDGGDFWLADGYHRIEAYKEIGALDIPVEIHQGSFRDAILFSISANATHGKRRTNEDKRKAVMTLLNDMEWGNWSNREIARKAGVDETIVRRLREPLSAVKPQITSPNPEVTQEKQFTRNGKTYTMNTENIGKSVQRRDGTVIEREEPEDEKIIRSSVAFRGVPAEAKEYIREMFEEPEEGEEDDDENESLPITPVKPKPVTDEEAERLVQKALGSPEQQAVARALLGSKADDILIGLNTALFDFNNRYEKYAFRMYEQLDRAEDYSINLVLESIDKAENFFAQFKQRLKIAGRKAR